MVGRDLAVNARALAIVLALVAGLALRTPAAGSKPAPVTVVGQLLALEDGYLVFTTGDAVKLEPALTLPKHVALGVLVRATIDPESRTVVVLEIEPKHTSPDDIDAAHLPREYVVASPASLRSPPPAAGAGSGLGAHAVTVTIDVHVPASTPIGDDVYLATDRTNFAPAELRMIRIDAATFSVSLTVAPGTQLRYEFTRGNFSSIERDRRGGLVEPRSLVVNADVTTHDSVAAWADVN